MALSKDESSFFEVKHEGTTLRVNKRTGQVMDTRARLIKSDIRIIVAALKLNGHKRLANKVLKRYRDKLEG
jgi:hypothetical protein